MLADYIQPMPATIQSEFLFFHSLNKNIMRDAVSLTYFCVCVCVCVLLIRYYSVSKSGWVRWAGHLAHMGDKINTRWFKYDRDKL